MVGAPIRRFSRGETQIPAGMTPPNKTRFEMLLSTKEREMHHRGQLILIERMLGIVPHLTRRMQERMATTSRDSGANMPARVRRTAFLSPTGGGAARPKHPKPVGGFLAQHHDGFMGRSQLPFSSKWHTSVDKITQAYRSEDPCGYRSSRKFSPRKLGTGCEGATLRVNFGIGWRSFPGC